MWVNFVFLSGMIDRWFWWRRLMFLRVGLFLICFKVMGFFRVLLVLSLMVI